MIEEARENGKRRELEKPSHVPGKPWERRGWPDNRKGKGRSCEGGGGARKSEESPESGTEQRGPAVEDPKIKGREGTVENAEHQSPRPTTKDIRQSEVWQGELGGFAVHTNRTQLQKTRATFLLRAMLAFGWLVWRGMPVGA